MNKTGLSIWFLIGLQLTIYGLLIMGAGIYGMVNSVSPNIVLADVHAGIWWGAIMLLLGIFYSLRFRPRR